MAGDLLHSLLEERQGVVAQVEELDVEVFPLPGQIEYPLGRFFTEPVRAAASDNHLDP